MYIFESSHILSLMDVVDDCGVCSVVVDVVAVVPSDVDVAPAIVVVVVGSFVVSVTVVVLVV